MPELAEVEHSRRQWDPGIGQRVQEARVARAESRIFRGTDAGALCAALPGRTLVKSECRGKQMRFEFSGGASLGVHLGMRGELRSERETAAATFTARKHDYLVLRMRGGAVLAFEDLRLFGMVDRACALGAQRRVHAGGDGGVSDAAQARAAEGCAAHAGALPGGWQLDGG